jgi:hypothetical protein
MEKLTLSSQIQISHALSLLKERDQGQLVPGKLKICLPSTNLRNDILNKKYYAQN